MKKLMYIVLICMYAFSMSTIFHASAMDMTQASDMHQTHDQIHHVEGASSHCFSAPVDHTDTCESFLTIQNHYRQTTDTLAVVEYDQLDDPLSSQCGDYYAISISQTYVLIDDIPVPPSIISPYEKGVVILHC
jgi:hypothetical protein